MAPPDPSTAGVKWRFPAIHPEGYKFVLIACALVLVSWLLRWEGLAWLLTGLAIWVAAFFRDPVRVTPQGEGLIVAPADGLVTLIRQVPLPPELAGSDRLGDQPMTRVSIFMSVFDVHINRAPIAGTVRQVTYIPGLFLNADLDKASENNERQYFLIEGQDGVRIGFTQIAGLVARRIVGIAKPGDMVTAGQRIGLIRFGSRLDVFLPEDYVPQVAPGQRSVAGETIIARKGGATVSGVAQ